MAFSPGTASEISIPAGTIVFDEDSDRVTLLAPVYAAAIRETDGSWAYEVGGRRYFCAGGCAEVPG